MRTLLVTVDSLRYDAFIDHMPMTQHRLDWIHTETYSTGPNTGEAFPAIIGGVYPRKIGLPHTTSVAREFDDYSAGFSTNHLLSPKYGYGDGFDVFTSPTAEGGNIKDRAARIVNQGTLLYRIGARAMNLFETVSPTRFSPSYRPANDVIRDFEQIRWERDDWFVWLHFMEPHHPYEPPTAEDRLRARQLSRSVIAGNERREDRQDEVRAYYLAEVEGLDRELTRLWDSLPQDARVVFCADHGELLGEGGQWGHVGCFKRELLHVPLGGINLPKPGDLASLIDVPSVLLGADYNQGTLSREIAYATDGQEWAAIDGEHIATPEGVFDLQTNAEAHAVGLRRAQASFDVKTGVLDQADEEDLRALGYL